MRELHFTAGRASRRFNKPALTLFFLTLTPTLASAAETDYDVTLSGYVSRMVLALLLFGLAGFLAVRYLPGRLRPGAGGRVRLIGAMNVGRDMIYIVRTGPQVVALFVGKASSSVIGRWTAEEWADYEASLEAEKNLETPLVKPR